MRSSSRWLRLILSAYLALGVIYALITPPFEASDELWHYPLVRHLADGNPLPVQDPTQVGPWRQEASQPPLYYYLAGGLMAGIQTDDMESVRRLNPHVDNGVITSDGNINLALHDPRWNPWQGALLAVRVARLFSVGLGALTVLLTYALARAAFPRRPDIVLGATAFNAFLPMFLFISGSVNNDNLIMPLASLALWLMARLVARPGAPHRIWRWLGIGLVIGAAALTKVSGVGLLPLAAGALVMAEWRRQTDLSIYRRLGRALLRAIPPLLLIVGVVAATAGWWYARNLRLYGDWNGWSAFIRVLGQRAHPATLAQLWDERAGFLMSFWGLFGGVNVSMSAWVYRLLNGVLLASVGGFALRLIQAWRRSAPGSIVRSPAAMVEAGLNSLARRFPLVVCGLWLAAVVVGVIQWATLTWSSQGRLVFSALSAESLLLSAGLLAWLPYRQGRWLSAALSGCLFVVAALAPFVWIQPAYRPPAPYAPPGRPLAAVPGETGLATFNGQLRLNAATLSAEVLEPGQSLDVYLTWEVLAPLSHDWSVFVHLDDPILENPVAQRDMYVGQGLLLTTWLTPGQLLTNHYHLTLPPTVVTPADLLLRVGWYDYQSGARLPLDGGGDAATLATLLLRPRAGATPNPLAVNFGDEMELVGYDLPVRRLSSADALTVTLYVRPKRPLAQDYSFFGQVLAESAENTTRYAAFDILLPTSTWPAGDVQTIAMRLPIEPATPPGVYRLAVGIYTQRAGQFQNLPLVSAEGRITNENILTLTKIRLDE